MNKTDNPQFSYRRTIVAGIAGKAFYEIYDSVLVKGVINKDILNTRIKLLKVKDLLSDDELP